MVILQQLIRAFFVFLCQVLSVYVNSIRQNLQSASRLPIVLANKALRKAQPFIQTLISKNTPALVEIVELQLNELKARRSNNRYSLLVSCDMQFYLKCRVDAKLVQFDLAFDDIIKVRSLQLEFVIRNGNIVIQSIEVDVEFGFSSELSQVINLMCEKIIGVEIPVR